MKKGELLSDRKAPAPLDFWTVAYVFFICAFVGWIWEEVYCLVKHGFWVERGFLFGPILPIYGLGGIAVYFFKIRLGRSVPLVFVLSALSAGVIEFVGSWLLELIYNRRWWDYSGVPFNLGGRVHLVGLLFFGAAACLVAYFVLPGAIRLLGRIKRRVAIRILGAMLAVFSVDVIVSVAVNFRR